MSNLKVSSALNNTQAQKINFSGENNDQIIKTPAEKPDEFISQGRTSKKNVREQITEALQTYNNTIKNARQAFKEAVQKAREELSQKMKELSHKNTVDENKEPKKLPTPDEMRKQTDEHRRRNSGSGLCMYSIPEVY